MRDNSITTTEDRLQLLIQRYEAGIDAYAAQAKAATHLVIKEARSQGDIPTPQDILHILEMGGGVKVITVGAYQSYFGPVIALPGQERVGWDKLPADELTRSILVPRLGRYKLTITAEPVQDGE